MEKYTEGRILGDDEFLARFEETYATKDGMPIVKSVYLTKYTQKRRDTEKLLEVAKLE